MCGGNTRIARVWNFDRLALSEPFWGYPTPWYMCIFVFRRLGCITMRLYRFYIFLRVYIDFACITTSFEDLFAASVRVCIWGGTLFGVMGYSFPGVCAHAFFRPYPFPGIRFHAFVLDPSPFLGATSMRFLRPYCFARIRVHVLLRPNCFPGIRIAHFMLSAPQDLAAGASLFSQNGVLDFLYIL